MSDLSRKIYNYINHCLSAPECIFHVTKKDIFEGVDQIIKKVPQEVLDEIRKEDKCRKKNNLKKQKRK